ncbi:hypothetical protein WA577_000453 [Blastocystis sp. JDR]
MPKKHTWIYIDDASLHQDLKSENAHSLTLQNVIPFTQFVVNPVEEDHRISFQTCNCYAALSTGTTVFQNSEKAEYRITYDELIVFSNASMKQEVSVESFINGNYNSYKDDRIKYYHTDTVKEPMDSYKPIRIVTVRAFDAHNCPGSCMFLFEMFEGSDDHFESFFSMLYTGDFRYNEDMKSDLKYLIDPIPSLTLLHVDDTACLLNKNSFTGIPYSREDAINTIHYLINKMKKGKKSLSVNIVCSEREDNTWIKAITEPIIPGFDTIKLLSTRGNEIKEKLNTVIKQGDSSIKLFITDKPELQKWGSFTLVIALQTTDNDRIAIFHSLVHNGCHCNNQELKEFCALWDFKVLASQNGLLPPVITDWRLIE